MSLSIAKQAMANDWLEYKKRFIDSDGRVIDTGNHNISHSEGQGYGMLLAAANDDKPCFDMLWEWTRKNLGRYDLPLFSWKFDPDASPSVVDDNNATDGDILIAWALFRAGRQWKNSNYLNISRRIRQTILSELVWQFGEYWVVLPGLKGFKGDEYIDINLSYWVLPAFQDFALEDNQSAWMRVHDSGLALLSEAHFGDTQLPTDWIRLDKTGRVSPAPGWPEKFGADAVRIGLYFGWAGYRENNALKPIRLYWQATGSVPPGWINVRTSDVAHYGASNGVIAIKQYLNGSSITKPLSENDDYYSASLLMLTKLANKK